MYHYWLTLLSHIVLILVLLPIVGAVLVMIVGKNNRELAQMTTITNVLLTIILAVIMFWNYQPGMKNKQGHPQRWQMVSRLLWLAELQPVVGQQSDATDTAKPQWSIVGPDIRMAFGVDGVSALLLLLVPVLTLLAIGVNYEAPEPQLYFALLLLTESAVLASLAALDLVLYVLSLEAAFLCCFLLIGRWGEQNRRRVVVKFAAFRYTGSLLVLLGLVGLVISASFMQTAAVSNSSPVFAIDQILVKFQSDHLHTAEFRAYWQQSSPWIFICLFCGMLLQLPLFPFHTWLPNAQLESPYSVSISLTSWLPLLGIYPVLRFLVPLFAAQLASYHNLIAWWCVLAAMAMALLSLAQDDLKKKCLYAVLCAQSIGLLAVISLNSQGLQGGLLLCISTALAGGLLMFVVSLLETRYETREPSAFGGLMYIQPYLSGLLIIGLLVIIAAPGLSGFPAMILSVLGMFQGAGSAYPFITVLTLLSWLLMCWSVLWAFGQMLFGPIREPLPFSVEQSDFNRTRLIVTEQSGEAVSRDLQKTEAGVVLPALMLILLLGLVPQLFIDKLAPALQTKQEISAQAELQDTELNISSASQ